MSDPQSPFSSEYRKGGSQTGVPPSEAVRTPPREREIVPSQTTSAESAILPPVNHLIETIRYGTGKPRRVVIRGKITRE
jgi:hypothetical protein